MSDAEHEMLIDNTELREELAVWHRIADALLQGPHSADIAAALVAAGLERTDDGWVVAGTA